MRIPDEVDLVQELDAFWSHGRRLSFVVQLELSALSFHPSSELRVGRVRMRDKAISMLAFVQLEFFHAKIPTLLVIWIEPTAVIIAAGGVA